MQTAEQIAAGLSGLYRDRMLAPDNASLPAGIAVTFIRHGLIEAHPTDMDGWRWSPKGLAVRAILKEQNNEQQ